jgi:hypothetical protein
MKPIQLHSLLANTKLYGDKILINELDWISRQLHFNYSDWYLTYTPINMLDI